MGEAMYVGECMGESREQIWSLPGGMARGRYTCTSRGQCVQERADLVTAGRAEICDRLAWFRNCAP